MEAGKPSRTAFAAAGHRAAHQELERGLIFPDPLAIRILGPDAEEIIAAARTNKPGQRMRFFIAMRSRFAEDALAAAVASGVSQLVILGAGLDTFAYRNPFADKLRVFEVDFPATQAWKRERLADAGISIPPWLRFAPVDFERQTLAEGLAAAGFDPERQTFVTWLGVVPYLTREAIFATLGFIAALPGGAHVVFDYGDPPETLDPADRAYHFHRAKHVAAIGERWLTYFEPAELRRDLLEMGFLEVEDLRPNQLVERFFPGRSDPSRRRGGHVLRAWTL